jgi:hypothetical protein
MEVKIVLPAIAPLLAFTHRSQACFQRSDIHLVHLKMTNEIDSLN